jgi:hypothetical protein
MQAVVVGDINPAIIHIRGVAAHIDMHIDLCAFCSHLNCDRKRCEDEYRHTGMLPNGVSPRCGNSGFAESGVCKNSRPPTA